MANKSTRNRNRTGFDPMDDSTFTEKSKVLKILPKKINIKAKNLSQKECIRTIKDNEISFVSGVAGTGKTFLAIATALDLLADKSNDYCRLYFVKSVTTLPNEEIGFLKGELKEKIEPFMWSYMMNVEKLIGESTINSLLMDTIIRPLPLAYIRGLSIDNSIIILDETQNITLDTLRTIMTRIGENTKLVMLGDIKQIDMKNKNNSALKTAIEIFKDVDGIGIFNFSNDDIVRNPLIKIIEQRFDKHYEGK